jgi:hypothetical protein
MAIGIDNNKYAEKNTLANDGPITGPVAPVIALHPSNAMDVISKAAKASPNEALATFRNRIAYLIISLPT